MDLICSFVICIAMYSIIPMPKIEWTDKKMRFCFCFFPIIGIIIGVISFVIFNFLSSFSINFLAILLLLVPILISGGIHLDGLIDSCDAFFSFGDKQKKLDILKDPRTGAFGVIGAIVYFILLFASYSQILINAKFFTLLPFTFINSRTIGSICMLCVKNARNNGLGATFSKASNKITVVVLCLWLLASFIIMLSLNTALSLLIIAFIGVFLLFYIPYIKREFGGITGDLTGFIIAFLEFLIPFIIAIGGVVL
ncbi:MAG: adenosylcobinamide-GDP ribazoletransferase [Clostridia bacterium]